MRQTQRAAAAKALAALGIEPRKSWTLERIKLAECDERARITSVCRQAIATAERYAKCYFWSNTGSASQRRREEFDSTGTFVFGGEAIEVHQHLNISCRNFYFCSEVTCDGRRSNILTLKKILAVLTA